MTRIIEGITPDKFYTVNGLIPATPYLYRVKALYVNGTESLWSSYKEVLLKDGDTVIGDVNNDGSVTIDDIATLIDYLLKGEGDVNVNAADVNNDGNITIDDIAILVDYLLKGEW